MANTKSGVHQVVTGLTYGDAITHHSLAIRGLLRDWGFFSDIFAEHVGSQFIGIGREIEHLPQVIGPNDLIIFHHSIHSKATDIIREISNPLILVYHNITPAFYFLPFNEKYTALLDRGRKELGEFASKAMLALADSEYNRLELEACGFSKTKVFPIIFRESIYRQPFNKVVYQLFRDDYLNIVSVGRIVPQKRIEDLLKTFAIYRQVINNKARLILVGNHRGFEPYLNSLLRLIERLKLGDVYFTGLVPFNELLAYYHLADILVSTSEHEGFCVPLVEGMIFQIPIMARSCGAVPETLSSAGVLFQDRDPLFLAELIHYILENKNLRDQLISNSKKTLSRFSYETSKNNLRSVLQSVLEVS
ncbi:glycosyltransferase family 4 protein [candidate division CSSED10-310 bacterium]|uniref:Glycosyltransferase family 4 protein n=1 Tax=candidate division CSSED10-310 bacterium TaxID=2855610 RepID=A0ABV6YZX1_UNCC1